MKIAIIPARGGSKRIPRKNIKEFCGKPIISYSIDIAQKANCFDRIIVSTDDDEIADIARSFGAEVPFLRRSELADDFTGTNQVVANTLERLEIKGGYACCIYATAPFIKVADISEGIRLLDTVDSINFAVSVAKFQFPIQRALKLNNNVLQLKNKEHVLTRSQDLEEFFHDAGQLYWGRVDSFISGENLFLNNTAPVELPSYRVQDIDTLDDWTRAEYLFKVWCDQGRP